MESFSRLHGSSYRAPQLSRPKFASSTTMKPTNAASRLMLRRNPHRLPRPRRLLYSTDQQQTVQTPIQSQNKGDISPIQPEAEGRRVQTPVQSQNNASFVPSALRHTQPRRPPSNAGPLYTFWGLLVATPLITYGYYVYRKNHMETKWAKMLREAQEKRAGG